MIIIHRIYKMPGFILHDEKILLNSYNSFTNKKKLTMWKTNNDRLLLQLLVRKQFCFSKISVPKSVQTTDWQQCHHLQIEIQIPPAPVKIIAIIETYRITSFQQKQSLHMSNFYILFTNCQWRCREYTQKLQSKIKFRAKLRIV